MKAILKLFTQSWFLVLLGLALLSLAIWNGGPYLAFGSMKPLESVVSRLIAILVLVVLWTLWVQIRQYRARKAGDQLAKDVGFGKETVKAGRAAEAGSADAAQLRARFEEAIAALRSSQGKSVNLYELPWYIIIGPPGAGKTTAIANSGLNFPLSKKFGKEALRGVGGTRNCDWWFTHEAILLDTAGRYTTQDSDAESDHAGWIEFLSLLRRHRSRRPINGVIVAISAPDLLSASDSERRRHVEAVRRRLEELTRELRISLPVYFVLTKLDLIAGFTEFFDDLNQEGRAQVWGATFPIEVSRSGAAADSIAAEFDQLLERLNGRLMLRIESERDVRRRALIFTFPRQFAALRRALLDFTGEAFAHDEGREQKVQLRGVYFTSGTQEGTPIDRMLGALARTFGLSVRGAVVQPQQGRAYFIQRLLREVLFRESGLAGVNRRMELRQALANGGAYIGVCLLIVLGIAALSISYKRNHDYLATVAQAAESLKAVPAHEGPGSLVQSLDRLEALGKIKDVAAQPEASRSLSMRWGLYQGRSVTNAVQDAYVRELNAGLLPAVSEHFANRLASFAGEPDKLYEYLKAYLMLSEPEHLDPKQLGFIGNLEWQRVFANDPTTLERVATHFNALIAEPERVQPRQYDSELVKRARVSLQQASLPVLMYSRLKLSYADDAEHAIDVAREIGLGGDSIFVRKSGASLSQPIPALYTKSVFKDIAGTGKLQLVAQFVSENWVLGGELADLAKSPQLGSQLMALYEDDYIRVWDALLADLTLRQTSGTQDAAELWGLLAAPTSPFKRLLTLVQANTKLVEAPGKPGVGDKAKAAIGGTLGSLTKVLGGQPQPAVAAPGAKVTKHFEALHKLAEGSPAPIDLTLQKFGTIQGVMAEISALGGTPPLETASRLSLALKDLATHAKTLPAPMNGLVERATGKGASDAEVTIRSDLSARYRQQVVAECQELAAGRYPLLVASGVDLPLADFARLFAPNGTFDAFLRNTMQSFVDTNRPVWRWKPEAASIGGPATVPAQFQRANRIAQTYFAPGATMPEVRFTVTPDYLDAAAARMVLEIDGQTLEYRHGPTRAVAMTWPGPSPGQAAISLEERAGARPNIVEQGPWALFRLLGKAQLQAQGETRFLATFTLGERTVRVVVQANSSRNPFARDLLHGFNCQG
ncbi:MAG TPA: type VI secretion system membrane subunit TssM [Steroidobacteraceae bacterium]|nr:type VI secretion system membrane subunit TssM [Steroidobacteraceae bacterium]